MEELEEGLKLVCSVLGILSRDGCNGIIDNYAVRKLQINQN